MRVGSIITWNYVAAEGKPPLFVVELACSEDVMEVRDYSVILRVRELNHSGQAISFIPVPRNGKGKGRQALNEKALGEIQRGVSGRGQTAY